LLAAIFLIFYSQPDLDTKLKVRDPAINATAWGVIGAVLRAMWFLKSKVDMRTYRNAYNIYFISVPFLGGILGTIIYLLFLGGLFALQGGTQSGVE
jgi:membrane associated rhomboid family serine protease